MSTDSDAARIMAEATSHFIQEAYAIEAIRALRHEGWTIAGPVTIDESGRAYLQRLGPIVAPARDLRYLDDDRFEGVADAEVEIAARNLRAIGYSCQEGARKLERIRARRAEAKT